MNRASSASSSALAPPRFVRASACFDDSAARERGRWYPLPIPECSMSHAALTFTWIGCGTGAGT